MTSSSCSVAGKCTSRYSTRPRISNSRSQSRRAVGRILFATQQAQHVRGLRVGRFAGAGGLRLGEHGFVLVDGCR